MFSHEEQLSNSGNRVFAPRFDGFSLATFYVSSFSKNWKRVAHSLSFACDFMAVMGTCSLESLKIEKGQSHDDSNVLGIAHLVSRHSFDLFMGIGY